MKKLLLTALIMITPFAGAWGDCCGPCLDHQEETPTEQEVDAPDKQLTCPDCRPEKEDRSYAGCATCSAYGKHERQCGVCGQNTVQARCPSCPVEK